MGASVGQKIGVGIFGLIFIALSALIASLPATSDFNNGLLGGTATAGDTAWMISATIIGLILVPFLGILRAMNGHGNYVAGGYIALLTLVIVSFFWILFTFSLVWGNSAQGTGILSYPRNYYMFAHVGPNPDVRLAPFIPLSIFAIFELIFACLTPTLIGVHLIGRIDYSGWAFFVFLFHITIWCPIANMAWNPDGHFAKNNVQDYAGGVVVHILAGVGAFAADVFFGKREVPDDPHVANNITLVSTILSLLGWFALTAGKAHAANGVAAQAIATTLAGVVGSSLTWLIIDFIGEKKHTPQSISNAIMIGLVSISSSAGSINVGGALCTGITAVLITYPVAFGLLKERVDGDHTLSVITVHGVAGIVGFLCTAIFAYENINYASYNGLTFGRGIPLAYHISAILVFVPIFFVAVWACLLISHFFFPIMPEPEIKETPNSESAMEKIEDPSFVEVARINVDRK